MRVGFLMHRSCFAAALAFIFAANSVQATPPPRHDRLCVHGEFNTYLEDTFVNDLRGIGFGYDVFGYFDQYALVNCATRRQVMVLATQQNRDLTRAQTVIWRMIANDKEETLQDVVERMRLLGYKARVERVSRTACYCDKVE